MVTSRNHIRNRVSHLTIKSVCVYCGSSNHADDIFKKAAQAVGSALAHCGYRVIYGGGHVGLMGLVADSALQAGGEVIGIIPEHIKTHEMQHTGLTELIVVDSMHIRKDMMAEKADAFIALPGGFGTLDELFEIMTWKQLGLHTKPIVIYNIHHFWDPVLGLIDHIIDQHFAIPEHRELYTVATNLNELFTALNAPIGHSFDPEKKWD